MRIAAGEARQQARIKNEAECEHGKENDRYRQRMAERNGNERQPDQPLTAPIETERHREQPTHRRIDAVKHAKAGDGDP
jgi:hypothetical protein